MAMRLQRRATAAVLARLGLWYLPRILLERLWEFDVQYALVRYFSDCGLDYDVLVTPSHVEHASQRARLERLHDLLLMAEGAIQGIDFLRATPVLEALKVSEVEAERVVSVLGKVAAVWRAIQSSKSNWPAFVGFRRGAQSRLRIWQTISDQELADIFAAWYDWQSLQERMSAALAGIASLKESTAQLDAMAEILLVVNAASDKCKRLVEDLDNGVIEPATALPELEDLFLSIESLFDEPAATTAQDEIKRQWCCQILGISIDADQRAVEKAYRQLAKIWHPDVNKTDDAIKRMQEINDAKDYLTLYLEHQQ